VPEQLDDEEWISAGAFGERFHQSGWRVSLAERREGTLHIGVRERAQDDGACVPLTDKLIERCLDGLRREDVARLTTNPIKQAMQGAPAFSNR
jgi:hypothetical protein